MIQSYGRYYCPRHPKLRVLPYDSFDRRTVAPKDGRHGQSILLTSLNGRVKAGEDKWGYCWQCERFVLAFRRDSSEIRRLYMERIGIRVLPYRPVQLHRRRKRRRAA